MSVGHLRIPGAGVAKWVLICHSNSFYKSFDEEERQGECTFQIERR